MKRCPQCEKKYSASFQFCPIDGTELPGAVGDESDDSDFHVYRSPTLQTHISLRTLMLALGVLVLVTLVAFSGAFFYLSLKPQYGALVVKTTPPGAIIFVQGKQRGVSPLTLGELRTGGYKLKAVKEGYKDYLQQVEVVPYATESLHLELQPLVASLTNEQLAEVESWTKKLDNARKEGILLPPPEDYNALFFAHNILAIDPANAYAVEAKEQIADDVRHKADVAYARESWLEAEKQYQNLALLYPDDIAISERLADIDARIDASVKNRQRQIEALRAKAEAAMKDDRLVPPDKDNALEAYRSIQRLDKKNANALEGITQIKEMLQNRGDMKISSGDWQGAREDFKIGLQYFPGDSYSSSRLDRVMEKLDEVARAERQGLLRKQEEQQLKRKIANLRQSALTAYQSGSFAKANTYWTEYLKYEGESDEAYFYLGASFLEQKQHDTAILNFEKCVLLNPRHSLAHLNLGILYDRQRNDVARATEHLRKAEALGGVENYGPERIRAMIRDLEERAQLLGLHKTPFPVEHKHLFSSCRGDLKIGREGVEFRTADTDHSFYETYGNLRDFNIDGEDIRIRTRNNKKYNFRLLIPGDVIRARRLAASKYR